MSRLALAALILTSFLPLSAYAQSSNNSNSNDQTTIGQYGQDFLYGQSDEEKQKEEKGQQIWQYDSKYHHKPDTGEDAGPPPLLPQGEQFLYFIRTADTKNNEAILRLSTPASISGCVDVVPPRITLRRSAGTMAFKVEEGALALEKNVRYAHYQCNQNSHSASADITLNRDELLENNIKTLTFQSGSGAMDTYEVELSGNRLSLIPKTSYSFKPFEGSTKADPLTYYFYPDNIVVLYVPGADKKADLSKEIISLAQAKGLSPASYAPLNNGHAVYFTDQQGTLSSSLAFDANAFVGTVKEPQTFQGPNGAYEQDKGVDVYAKRPGTLD
jgi:hypothetical protein